nr:multidrug effflux MFS transporter [Variibacter gotjawalensis]
MILLIAITSIAPLALNMPMPALPGIARSLQAPIEVVQLTLSLYLVVVAVAQLVNGALSDRYGRRPVLIAGLALATVASIAAALASSIGYLIVARSFQAIGASAGIVLSRAIIRDLYDREQAATMLGWVTMAIMIVPLIVPYAGGVIDTTLGWPYIFISIAAMTAVVLAWAVAKLPETWRAPLASADPVRYRDDLAALFANRKFCGYVICCASGSALFFIMLGGAPHVVVTEMGRTPAELGLWLTTGAAGYMLGNYTSARYSQRVGVDRMVTWGSIAICLASAITTAWVWSRPHGGPLMLFAPQLITAFGNGLVVPNAIAGAISVRPRAAGTASGIAGFLQMAVGGIGAQAIAHIVAAYHSALPLALVLFGMALICLTSCLLLIRRP